MVWLIQECQDIVNEPTHEDERMFLALLSESGLVDQARQSSFPCSFFNFWLFIIDFQHGHGHFVLVVTNVNEILTHLHDCINVLEKIHGWNCWILCAMFKVEEFE